TDVVTSGMLWLGLRWSTKPADENHPYGHGKAEALVALGISLALVGAAFIIIKDSISHIQSPHKTPAPYTLIILVVVVISKELLYRFILKTGKEIQSGAVKADAFHHRSDAITSIAAFIGISIALWGGKGYEVADDYAALIAGAFIIYNAYWIGRPAIGELLDEALEPEFHKEIILLAEQIPNVKKVEKSHARKMGPAYHVDLHIWVDSELTVEKGHQIAHKVKDRLIESIPQIIDVHIHIEPG
ncbi:MAG: cation diffusion facilitator family transporter, partial [Cytophagales bacterium]